MAVDHEIHRLVQTTLRIFYEAKYTIVIDQLVRKEAMRDEELAAKIGLSTKDVYKLANKLAEEGFLATHRRNELKPGAMKATGRTWYYIDYQRTIDNIKWRLYKIRKVIDDKLRNELDQQGYVCPKCKKRFSTLDAGALLDFTTNTMRCDVCGTDVVDNENVEDVKRSKDQMNRLLEQTRPIVDGLKKTEKAPLLKFDIAEWLEKHHPIAAQGDLPIPSSSGPAKVTIELVDAADDSEAKRKREAEAESKRVQNALPSWIERSTITGELTAVGAAQHKPSGITIEGAGAGADKKDGTPSPKKAAHTADNDVDAYYAALAEAQSAYATANATAAASAATKKEGSSEASPPQGSPSSSLPAHARLADSGYEEFGDDAFSAISPASPASNACSPAPGVEAANVQKGVHPRMPSLRPPSAASVTQSLGKRSRETSEESDQGKKARTEANTPVERASPVADPAVAAAVEGFEEEVGEAEAGDDPILTVNGKELPFSTITEDMTAEMTPDEYQLWWETMAVVG